jgi:hypothetical protein
LQLFTVLQSPATKLKLGEQQIGERLLIANHLDQSLLVHHQYLKWGKKVKKQVIKTHDEESSTQLGQVHLMSLTWGWEIIVTVTPFLPKTTKHQDTHIKQHHIYFQNAKRKAEKNSRTV